MSQFEGYDDLEDLDWYDYRRRYDDIHRLDRILEAEDDDVNRLRLRGESRVQHTSGGHVASRNLPH